MRRIGRARLTRRAGAAVSVVLLFGCAGSGFVEHSWTDSGSSLPPAHHIQGVPFVPGEPGACGPAALASVLGHRGDRVTVEDIARAIAAPSLAGVLPLDLERYASSRGVGATVHAGSLAWVRARVASEHPVVVFLDLGLGPWRQGHFVVVVGYDDAAARLFLYSGRDSTASMSYRRFMTAWERTDRWALTLEAANDERPGGASAS